MIIDLTCPHCHAVVAAREADRGETIRCGICWQDVPVPAASLVPAPPPDIPAPMKAAALPTAKLIPPKPTAGPAPLPTARPVAATPVPVAPVPIAVSPAKAVPAPPRMRSARRDEDEFVDRPARSSNAGTLALIAVLGLLVVGGLTAGIIVLVQNTGNSDTADGTKSTSRDGYEDPKPLWDPKADPGKGAPPANDPIPPFNHAPFKPPAPKPAKEPEWVPVPNADGFEVLVPGAMPTPTEFKPLRINIDLGGRDVVVGKKYGSLTVHIFRVVFCGFEIHYADFPDGPFDAEQALRKMHIELRANWLATKTTLAGHPAVEIAADVTPRGVTPPNVQGIVVRGTKVGPRFFTVKFTYLNPENSPKWPEYRDKYFNSFKITHDPSTPAPAAPMGRGSPGRAGTAAVSTAVTAPYVIARPQPFWGAVFLTDKNELVTVGPRLVGNFGRGGGILRRYSLPGFQLKASYPMPRAATRAVYDVATSTLYCTTLTGTRPDNTIRDSERVVAFGDVEAYDLKPVFNGTAAEKDELRPAFVVSGSGAKLTGLELSPDGKWLYTVRTTQLGTAAKPRGWKASLVRVDLAQRKLVDSIDLPTPVLHMTLAPDGRTIYLAEIPLSDSGGEVLGGGQAGKVDAVDASGWRIMHNALLSAPILDMSLTRGRVRLLCGVQGKHGPLIASAALTGGDVIEFDPPADPGRSAGYVAVSADGRRVVTAARAAEGIDVYEVQDVGRKDGLKLLSRGKEAAGAGARTPLGGHFYLSPDGRFAAFQVGAVIDIERPTKKPD